MLRPLLPLVFVLLLPAAARAGTNEEGAAYYQTVCAACHGPAGEGNREIRSPSIAGLPAWFSALQLDKFRAGNRGTGNDVTGGVMRAIALAVPEEIIPALVEHVASMPPHPTSLEDDEAAGEASPAVAELFYETCAPCHRFNAQGERVFRSAPLTTLPDWYLLDALKKFRDGDRGSHPDDVEGAKMREVTSLLSDETIEDLVRYLANLAATYPPGERRGRRR